MQPETPEMPVEIVEKIWKYLEINEKSGNFANVL